MKRLILSLIYVFVLALASFALLPKDMIAQSGGPVVRPAAYTGVLSGTGTIYSQSAAFAEATEMDVFVSAVIGTGTITVTPQVSIGENSWVDVHYNVPNSGAMATPGVTLALAATGAGYAQGIPAAGTLYRFKITHTGQTTPTIGVVLR